MVQRKQFPFRVLLISFLLTLTMTACSFFTQDGSEESSTELPALPANTPDIPIPSSVGDQLPQYSAELITNSELLDDFSVYISREESEEPAYFNDIEANGLNHNSGEVPDDLTNPNAIAWLSDYYPLVENSQLMGSYPFWGGWLSGSSKIKLRCEGLISGLYTFQLDIYYNPPLAERPMIQRVVYWELLDQTTVPYPTTYSHSYTLTQGTEETDAEEFSRSLSISVGSSFASVSASLSETFSHSVTISQEEEESKTYGCPSLEGKTIVFALWQLVERYEIVNQDGTLWYDANFTPAEMFLEPLVNRVRNFQQIETEFDS